MAERRGHPVAAALTVIWTLFVVAGCWFLVPMVGGVCELSGEPEACEPGGAAIVLLVVVLVGVLIAGLWCAWRVGTGGWGRRSGAAASSAAPSGRTAAGAPSPETRVPFDPAHWRGTHRVGAGGARAWTKAVDGPVVWVDLAGGTEVQVEGVSGSWALVTDRKGWSGRVDRASLVPLAGAAGGRGG